MTKGSAGALQVNCLVQLKLSADGDLRSEGAPGKSKAPRSIAGLDGPVEGEGAGGLRGPSGRLTCPPQFRSSQTRR